MNRLLLVWAVVATAFGLVMLGYALGRSGSDQASSPAALPGVPELATTADGFPESVAEVYRVPESLQGLPADWITQAEGHGGYAIRFVPDHRELIVEQCLHRGYFDERRGVPVPEGWDFCNNVLWGSLLKFEDTLAIARDREGRAVEVDIEVDTGVTPPTLSLEFGDHRMTLIPGSVNDLRQAIESRPDMMAQRVKAISRAYAEEDAQRRLELEAQKTGTRPTDALPVYSLPPPDDREEAGSDQ